MRPAYQLEYLLGDKHVVRDHVALLVAHPEIALLSPVPYRTMPEWGSHWLQNAEAGRQLAKMFDVPFADGFADYPMGGMFWCRPSAFGRFLEYNWTNDIFPPEKSQKDGTNLAWN